MKHHISVVVPCFNNAAHLERCLQSILSQEGASVELIVVDDGSTDNSESIYGRFETSCTIVRQANKGACHARNAGLRLCTAKTVKFLDADDYLAAGCLARQIEQLSALGRTDVSIYGDVSWLDASGDVVFRSSKLGCDDLRSGKGSLAFPLTSAPLHFTENVLRVGGFDPRLPRAQEFDLHIRMWLSGTDFSYSPGLTYYYVQHEGERVSLADRRASTYQARFEAYNRYLSAIDDYPDPIVRECIIKGMSRALWSLGRLALRNDLHGPITKEIFRRAWNLGGSGAVTGSLLYRLANKILGPRCCELLMTSLKR